MGWFIALAVVLLLIIAALVRSSWERRSPKIKEYEVESAALPEEFSGKRLVFLADLHGQRFGEGNRELIQLIREAKPDYLLIGGDMITVKPWKAPDFSALEELLSAFSGEVPLFYADGNHEERMAASQDLYPGWKAQFDRLLSSYQLTYLSNERIRITKGRASIFLYAYSFTGEQYQKCSLPELTKEEITEKIGPAEGFSVVLAHTPHYLKSFASWGADLVLSGHDHGGTIRLPLLGGVMTPQFFLFSKYAYGCHQEGKTTEIVSAGLGTHTINIRLFNRPEVVVVTIRRQEGSKEET